MSALQLIAAPNASCELQRGHQQHAKTPASSWPHIHSCEDTVTQCQVPPGCSAGLAKATLPLWPFEVGSDGAVLPSLCNNH